jgi:hypothetical protein
MGYGKRYIPYVLKTRVLKTQNRKTSFKDERNILDYPSIEEKRKKENGRRRTKCKFKVVCGRRRKRVRHNVEYTLSPVESVLRLFHQG